MGMDSVGGKLVHSTESDIVLPHCARMPMLTGFTKPIPMLHGGAHCQFSGIASFIIAVYLPSGTSRILGTLQEFPAQFPGKAEIK
jgi:hypothetical protein